MKQIGIALVFAACSNSSPCAIDQVATGTDQLLRAERLPDGAFGVHGADGIVCASCASLQALDPDASLAAVDVGSRTQIASAIGENAFRR